MNLTYNDGDDSACTDDVGKIKNGISKFECSSAVKASSSDCIGSRSKQIDEEAYNCDDRENDTSFQDTFRIALRTYCAADYHAGKYCQRCQDVCPDKQYVNSKTSIGLVAYYEAPDQDGNADY